MLYIIELLVLLVYYLTRKPFIISSRNFPKKYIWYLGLLKGVNSFRTYDEKEFNDLIFEIYMLIHFDGTKHIELNEKERKACIQKIQFCIKYNLMEYLK